MSARARGFTLLEIVVVVGILVVLAGALVVTLDKSDDTTKQQLALSEATALRDACLRWRSDMGRWPTRLSYLAYTLQEIRDEINAPATYDLEVPPALRTWNPATRRGWRGPYIALAHDAASPSTNRIVTRTTPSNPTRTASFIVDPWFASANATPPMNAPLDYQCYRWPAIDHPAGDPNNLPATTLTIICSGADGHFDNQTLAPAPESGDYNDPVSLALQPTADNLAVMVGSNP